MGGPRAAGQGGAATNGEVPAARQSTPAGGVVGRPPDNPQATELPSAGEGSGVQLPPLAAAMAPTLQARPPRPSLPPSK